MAEPGERAPVARKRFYLGGPALVGLIYFFGNLYPWARSCLVRSIPEARDVGGTSSPAPGRLVSFPWCLLMTLDRLNTISPPASGEPAVPSGAAPPSDHGKTEVAD
jgi:hypothetical protein